MKTSGRWISFYFWAAAVVLIGRSIQHIFYSTPYRAFFLDARWFGWYIGESRWMHWATDLATDISIKHIAFIIGIILLCFGLIFIFHRIVPRFILIICACISSLILLFLAFCFYLEAGYQYAQIIEFASQVFMPIAAVWFAIKANSKTLMTFIKIAIALTYTGHGLYALGLMPIPGNFVYMLIETLGVSDEQAIRILKIAGVMDLIVAVGIFIPKIDRILLFYALIWGFLTALARPLAYIVPNHLFWLTVKQTWFEFAVRVPHFILPLMATVEHWRNNNEQ